ncbi:MAG: monovalent cation/H(+) antiporter subunit G, partial [Acholeplasmataceae bacterium]|nr:monovalent cation/H(+) antiporter subunit G [Acholeplasmataceae bacterium]
MIYITYAILILSWLFILFGMIAIFKLKNLYARILTATTIDTVACFLVLFALIFASGSFAFIIRLILLIIFLLITNPISSHVNIRSAYLTGIP